MDKNEKVKNQFYGLVVNIEKEYSEEHCGTDLCRNAGYVCSHRMRQQGNDHRDHLADCARRAAAP
jgi:hypothetical protein